MYYYTSHVRNLQDEALLQKQKISAQLYQSAVVKHHEQLSSSRKSNGLSRSRRQEDRETAAFLQRSRLEAEFSAARTKAENSMNRARLESAFQIRKQNQKAFEQLSQMNIKHEELTHRAARQQVIAHHNFLESKEEVQARLRQEDRLIQLKNEEETRALEMERAYRNALITRNPYLPYW